MKPLFSERYHGVVVCASGGLDSTALFHAFWRFNKQQDFFRLAIFHMHYGLRGEESDADFRFVKDLAARHDVPFFHRIVSDVEREQRAREGVQEWARRLRYTELDQIAAAGWVIATAHHADDLAENVLLRLARGAAPGQWLGMEAWRPPYWKPFLQEKKAKLQAFLEREGLPYREDSSNAQGIYSRNVIRNEVLPRLEELHPGASDRLVLAAEEARDLARWMDAHALEQLGEPARADALVSMPTGVARHVLARFLAVKGRRMALSRRLLDLVLTALKEGARDTAWDFPGGKRLVVQAGILRVEPADSTAKSPKAERQSQHRKALAAPVCDLVLEPGSHASLRGNMGLSALPPR